MPTMDVRPALLNRAGDDCETNVTPPLDQAVTTFADASFVGGLDFLATASAARACVTGWRQSFREASQAMHAIGSKLHSTSSAVVAADQDAADLYRGVQPHLPPISINIGG